MQAMTDLGAVAASKSILLIHGVKNNCGNIIFVY